jgi:small subunit ribosomal protein S6
MVARSMPLYDLMLLLDPAAPSDRHEAILRDVQGMLESGGSVRGTYDWGTRRLAFEIDHRPDAAYHLFQFETAGGGDLLERVDHSLKIMDGVLRHRIIRLKDGAPAPPMPRPETRREHEHGEAGAPVPPERAEPADAPAVAESAAAAEPAAPADAPAPAPAEAPPAPDVATEEAGAAGGGDDDEAPSGGAAAG